MMHKLYIALFTGFILSIASLPAQQVQRIQLSLIPYSNYPIEVPNAKAIAFKCDNCSMDEAYLLTGADTMFIQEDPHEAGSALMLLPGKVDAVSLYSGKVAGDLEVYFIDAGTVLPKARPELRLRDAACPHTPVSPEVWRQGLPAPSYTPGLTEVRHIVIHHSATPNLIGDP